MGDRSKPARGCYLCMRRRITCDKAIPHCNKCKVKGLACPGYGVRFRFVPINTVIARGDPRMGSAVHPTQEVVHRPASKGSQASNQGTSQDPSTSSPESDCTGSAATQSENQYGHWNVVQTRASRRADSRHDLTSPPRRSSAKTHPFTPPSCQVPRILDPIEPLTRFLLDHFAKQISPIMVSFDGEGNGYRKYVMPLAHVDPLINQVLCATAAFHLGQHMPRLLPFAEKTRTAIIGTLRERASSVNALDDVTWAVIHTLILADLFTGCEDVVSLYHSLTSFIAARGTDVKSPMAQFLYLQAQLYSFFTTPLLGDYEDISTATIRYLDESTSDAGPSVQGSHELPQNLDVHCITSEIYMLRMESRVVPANENRMTSLLRQLRVLLENSEHRPNSHTLAWPCFLAAMESESRSRDDHRFFANYLRHIWKTTGPKTIPKTLSRMSNGWERKALGGWVDQFPPKKSL